MLVSEHFSKTGKECEIIAHRGASGEYPENTAEAFRAAIRQHADRIEFDVRVDSKGVPVVSHDAVDLPNSEWEGMLSLDEAMEVCGDYPLNIHIKDRRCIASVARVLRPNVIVSSESLKDIFELRTYSFWQTCELVCDGNFRENIPLAARYHCTGVNVPVEKVDPWVINGAQLFHLTLKAYVVNSKEELEKLIPLGISGVFTDFPAYLRQSTTSNR